MSNAHLDEITWKNNQVLSVSQAREQLAEAKAIVEATWPNLTADAQANAIATVANTIAVNMASRLAQQAAAKGT